MSFVRLVTRGRKTGLPHIVEVRYSWLGGSFYVIPGSSTSDWVLNLLHNRLCSVKTGDLLFETSVEWGDEAERKSAIEDYRRKYGKRFADQWYGSTQTCLRLTPLGPPKRREALTGEFNSKASLAEWKKSNIDYYAGVAAAFDSASEEYDFTISHNFINTWIRRRSIEVLKKYLRPDDFLLEIGCGTGAEAIEISKQVKGLLAIDVSQRMIDLFAAKVKARHLERKVFPLRLAAADLSKVREHLNGRLLRVAYSFNGALNCEPKMKEFVTSLSNLLEPDGIFVCSVRNSLCLSEALSHAVVLQFTRMSPRKVQPIMVSVGGRDIPSLYYSPRAFLKFFKHHFAVREIIALPGLLPPAYLNDYYLKFRTLTPALESLDRALSGRFPLNRFGDQTLFVLEKSNRAPGHVGGN